MNTLLKGFITLLTLVSISITASAFDFEVDGFQYSIVSLENKTAEISGVSEGFQVPKVLTLPSEVMYGKQKIKVVSVGKNVFSGSDISTLQLGDNLKVLDSKCFANCKSLQTVSLSESTDSIVSAFYGCINLKEVTFRSSYCFIDWNTFNDCKSLSTINIPSINEWCTYRVNHPLFLDCPYAALYVNGKRVEDINFPDNFLQVRDFCFASLKSIKSIVLPSDIKKIGEAAFAGTSIQHIKIPTDCDTICSEAFQGCQLSELVIPANVKYLEHMGSGFYAYGDLKIDNLIFEESTDPLVFQNYHDFMDRVSVVNLTINRPIKQITYQNVHYENGVWITDAPTLYSSAFYNMKSLESVQLGENVGLINARYFKGCSNLKKLIISDSELPIIFKQDFGFTKEHINYYDYYTPIYHSEFGDCPLEELYIGRNIVYERDYKGESYHELNGTRPSPFNSKQSVTHLTFGNNVDVLPADGLFENCPLKFISIGDKLVDIPENTFFHSQNSLETIVLYSEIPPTYETGFTNYDYVNATLYIPKGYESVYEATKPWSEFWNVTSDKYSGINYVVADNDRIGIKVQGNTIVLTNITDNETIHVFNINGQLIKTTTKHSFSLPKGYYILSVAGIAKKISIL